MVALIVPMYPKLMLFIVFYRNHVINFLNKEKLREDELTFRKLFEMNPFPLVVSRFEDSKILDANHKVLVFYDIPEEQFGSLNYNSLRDIEQKSRHGNH